MKRSIVLFAFCFVGCSPNLRGELQANNPFMEDLNLNQAIGALEVTVTEPKEDEFQLSFGTSDSPEVASRVGTVTKQPDTSLLVTEKCQLTAKRIDSSQANIEPTTCGKLEVEMGSVGVVNDVLMVTVFGKVKKPGGEPISYRLSFPGGPPGGEDLPLVRKE